MVRPWVWIKPGHKYIQDGCLESRSTCAISDDKWLFRKNPHRLFRISFSFLHPIHSGRKRSGPLWVKRHTRSGQMNINYLIIFDYIWLVVWDFFFSSPYLGWSNTTDTLEKLTNHQSALVMDQFKSHHGWGSTVARWVLKPTCNLVAGSGTSPARGRSEELNECRCVAALTRCATVYCVQIIGDVSFTYMSTCIDFWASKRIYGFFLVLSDKFHFVSPISIQVSGNIPPRQRLEGPDMPVRCLEICEPDMDNASWSPAVENYWNTKHTWSCKPVKRPSFHKSRYDIISCTWSGGSCRFLQNGVAKWSRARARLWYCVLVLYANFHQLMHLYICDFKSLDCGFSQ